MVEYKRLLSSEMVGRGHPDKMCDAIGDSILTEVLKQDDNSRVAIETTGGKGKLFITGEITTNAKVNIKKVARETLKKCGYPSYKDIKVIVNIGKQSQDIAQGVNQKNIGAGDQGIMYGYATDETTNYMPIEHYWATEVAKFIDKNLVDNKYGSDFKTQVTMSGKKIISVLASIQHNKSLSIDDVRSDVTNALHIFKETNNISYDFDIIVNPTGRFVSGWFDADAGTTGRKIVIDNYGTRARVGGGAFSGKDYTKVDRSAAYMCRFVAKNLVANGYAKKVEIQVAYVIGRPDPISIYIETFGTNKKTIKEIHDIVNNNFSFRVSDIIDRLELKTTDYTRYSSYGHFGGEATWEKVVKI